MKLAIKALKTMDGHDSLIFQCKVYVDGKLAFVASNDGNGGCNMYTPTNGSGWDKIREAEAWAKTLPPRTCEFDGRPFTYETDLDCVLDDLIAEELDRRWLKRQCRTKAIFRLPDAAPGEWMTVNAPFDERVQAWILNKYPNAIIANLTV